MIDYGDNPRRLVITHQPGEPLHVESQSEQAAEGPTPELDIEMLTSALVAILLFISEHPDYKRRAADFQKLVHERIDKLYNDARVSTVTLLEGDGSKAYGRGPLN